jgi:hypothetical protein
MSANVTTVAPTHAPPSNGLKGTAPAVFNGDRSRSESFWNEFRRYRLLNRNNDSISIPFFRVLTALSYIKGLLVEDWVNACDVELEKRTDRPNREASERATRSCGESSKPRLKQPGPILRKSKVRTVS